jgi:hypothetical protein
MRVYAARVFRDRDVMRRLNDSIEEISQVVAEEFFPIRDC